MFGFFKKKIDGEQLLNKGIFLVNFDKLFDGSGINTKNSSIADKILLFSVTLASLVASEAKGEESCQLKVSDSYERAASIIIYVQAVLTISEFIKFTDKEMQADVLNSGIHRLICIDFNSVTPQEHADMALATMFHKKLTKQHLDKVMTLNGNILEYLFLRKDEHMNNLTESWLMIVRMLTNPSIFT